VSGHIPPSSNCENRRFTHFGWLEIVELCPVENVMGYPGVFQGNLHPYPSKPVPAVTGAGFDRYG